MGSPVPQPGIGRIASEHIIGEILITRASSFRMQPGTSPCPGALWSAAGHSGSWSEPGGDQVSRGQGRRLGGLPHDGQGRGGQGRGRRGGGVGRSRNRLFCPECHHLGRKLYLTAPWTTSSSQLTVPDPELQ